MLRNWRIWPWSSRTWRERLGKRVVSSLRASAIVAALQSILGAPSVKRRKAVGISMMTCMVSSSFAMFLVVCCAERDAASGFGEDALSGGEELNGGDNFPIGNVLGPAARFAN